MATVTEQEAFVRLWRDDGFRGQEIHLNFKENVVDFRPLNFGDAASSIRWAIPDGWQMVLYKDDNYHSEMKTLERRGEIADLKDYGLGDKISSVRWEKKS